MKYSMIKNSLFLLSLLACSCAVQNGGQISDLNTLKAKVETQHPRAHWVYNGTSSLGLDIFMVQISSPTLVHKGKYIQYAIDQSIRPVREESRFPFGYHNLTDADQSRQYFVAYDDTGSLVNQLKQ